MFGFILNFLGTFFTELANSITKHQTTKYHIFQVGFIISLFSLLFFIIYTFIKVIIFHHQINLNPNGYWIIACRAILEIIQSYLIIKAIHHTDRSTFSLFRVLTIPFLLGLDIIFGYPLNFYSIIGIVIIIFAFLLILLAKGKINFKGWKRALIVAINAIFTISLFKYSITIYGNPVEVDQSFTLLSQLIFYGLMIKVYKLNYPNFWKDKLFLIQGLAKGFGSMLISFSYLFFASSVATTLKRGGEMFWSIIFGYKFFKEKHLGFKLFIAAIIFIGLLFLMY